MTDSGSAIGQSAADARGEVQCDAVVVQDGVSERCPERAADGFGVAFRNYCEQHSPRRALGPDVDGCRYCGTTNWEIARLRAASALWPMDWLVPCNHCERGNVVSLHADGAVWVNGKRLVEAER